MEMETLLILALVITVIFILYNLIEWKIDDGKYCKTQKKELIRKTYELILEHRESANRREEYQSYIKQQVKPSATH